ncbi:YceD family protein [Bradyrhizobium sp. 2TAF24]|uniref:YceD family protein n=1 Tax=Bradyrhizobium sp. 2TAF24 TaxID=3233011 RepID=UPI003F9222ED
MTRDKDFKRDKDARREKDARGAAAHPWSVRIAVDEIPEAGQHAALSADAAQRAAMAGLAGLRDIAEAKASFDLRPAGRGRIHVTGRVSGRIGQTCVVTLEPLESTIDEPVDLLFAPEDQVAAIIKAMEQEAEATDEEPDPPEAITDGTIDLGQLAADVLFLGIDPYPRKPGVVFEPLVTAEDPESHPFAALKALKDAPSAKPSAGKGPKNDTEAGD